ncbi:hypothetical protein B0H10DRAFT_2434533 [Mycena sp. CBHHK59/15]|nr:hypothetical protein B0H10DRAFT_2434533 [Mycena sp. CBHHK59/15]
MSERYRKDERETKISLLMSASRFRAHVDVQTRREVAPASHLKGAERHGGVVKAVWKVREWPKVGHGHARWRAHNDPRPEPRAYAACPSRCPRLSLATSRHDERRVATGSAIAPSCVEARAESRARRWRRGVSGNKIEDTASIETAHIEFGTTERGASPARCLAHNDLLALAHGRRDHVPWQRDWHPRRERMAPPLGASMRDNTVRLGS